MEGRFGDFGLLNKLMETSFYQLFKLHLLQYLPLTKDAVHVYLGLTTYFTIALIFKRFLSWTPVIAVLILALLMEAADLRDDYLTFGYFRWDASMHDIINTLFWPTVISLLLRLKKKDLSFDR